VLFRSESFETVANVARVLLVAAVFLSVNRTLEASLQGAARPLDAGIAEFIALAATVVGLVTLLPTLGLLGAALTSLLAYGVSSVWMSRRLATALESSMGDLVTPKPGGWRTFAARAGWRST